MSRQRPAAAAALLLLCAAAGRAEPVPAALEVRNTGPAPLVCELTLAHWFTLRFGPAGSGETLHLPLRFDAGHELVSVLNARGDEMAVEAMACGAPGNLQDTAARPAVRALARAATADGAALSCGADAAKGRVICTAE